MFFKDQGIRSLRDLNGVKHLKMLEFVREECGKIIINKHWRGTAIPPQFVFLIHYHPTFWYFHIHIANARHSMFAAEHPGDGAMLIAVDRFHKLETVIELLRLDPSYYRDAKLTTVVREPVAKL